MGAGPGRAPPDPRRLVLRRARRRAGRALLGPGRGRGARRCPSSQIQFQDFARWERSRRRSRGGPAPGRALGGRLDPDPPLLELPADRPRPPRESFDGRLGPAAARADAGRAAAASWRCESGATLFMVALAAFLAQLRRYSGRGRPPGRLRARQPPRARLRAADRDDASTRSPCAATSAATRPCGSCSRGCGRSALEAYANADAPFDAVVEALRPTARPAPLAADPDALLLPRRAPRGGALGGARRPARPGAPERHREGRPQRDRASTTRDGGADLRLGALRPASPTRPPTGSPATTCACSSSSSSAPTPGSPSSSCSRGPELAELEAGGAGPDGLRAGGRRSPALVEAPGSSATGERRPRSSTATERDHLRELARPRAGGRWRAPCGREGVRARRPGGCAARRARPRSVAAYLGVLEAGAAYVPLDPRPPARRGSRGRCEDAGAGIAPRATPACGRRLPAGVDGARARGSVSGPRRRPSRSRPAPRTSPT